MRDESKRVEELLVAALGRKVYDAWIMSVSVNQYGVKLDVEHHYCKTFLVLNHSKPITDAAHAVTGKGWVEYRIVGKRI